MKKSRITFYDKVVLVEKNGRWVETRSSAYKRYKNTIKPLEQLLKDMEW